MIDGGILIDKRLVHEPKAILPIEVMDSGRLIVLRMEQSQKTSLSMHFTESGIITDVSLLQLKNALSVITVTPG